MTRKILEQEEEEQEREQRPLLEDNQICLQRARVFCVCLFVLVECSRFFSVFFLKKL